MGGAPGLIKTGFTVKTRLLQINVFCFNTLLVDSFLETVDLSNNAQWTQ